jgi:hypothetical protein
MSKDEDKIKHSKRLHKEETAIQRQVKIAKQHRSTDDVAEPHRMAKRHAMDCGNPKCLICGNPRKTWNELTAQEKRQFQEMEITRLRHSNGTLPEDI